MSALGWSFLQEYDLETSARAGLAAASIAIESRETISPAMNVQAIQERMNAGNL